MTQLEKNSAKEVVIITAVLLLSKASLGIFAALYALYGCFCVFQRKTKSVVKCFVLLPLLTYFAPVICDGPYLGPCMRIGQVLLLLTMMISPTTRGKRDGIPIAGLFVFLAFAFISSFGGWFPLVSILKIANFAMFVIGIICIGKMMQDDLSVLEELRVLILALSFIIIVGSAIAYYIPSIGYSMEVRRAEAWGIYTTANELIRGEGLNLFSGVMNHSQTLATVVPLLASWLLCDMLFVEHGFRRLHVVVLSVAPILMYMSRSRTALVIAAAAVVMILGYCLPRAEMARDSKRKVVLIFLLIVASLGCALVVMESRDQMLSKWLRKNNDVASDSRSLVDAVTSTRMGLVELNLDDFKRRPMLGMGFQVMAWHKAAYQAGRISLISAPIEKGVLPLMILGETGILGGIAFLVFLGVFYVKCIMCRYTILMTLFTVMICCNFSEASFFSPGGGATEWTVCVVGGFCIDMVVRRRRRAMFSFSATKEWGP